MKKYRIVDRYGNSWGDFCIFRAIYSWVILTLFYKDNGYRPKWKIIKR